MYSIENKSEESRAIQYNAEKHVPTAQFKDNRSQNVTERSTTAQLEKKENLTGMPDNLKESIESLSGFSMDDVRVHYNSSKPATVQALAYTQGTDIHVAPGQEKHLPHEAWHVAQQMAGRVSPTTNINGMPVNDNEELEHEADVMGEKAVQRKKGQSLLELKKIDLNNLSVQRKYIREDERENTYEDLAGLFRKTFLFSDNFIRNHIKRNNIEFRFISALRRTQNLSGMNSDTNSVCGINENDIKTKTNCFQNGVPYAFHGKSQVGVLLNDVETYHVDRLRQCLIDRISPATLRLILEHPNDYQNYLIAGMSKDQFDAILTNYGKISNESGYVVAEWNCDILNQINKYEICHYQSRNVPTLVNPQIDNYKGSVYDTKTKTHILRNDYMNFGRRLFAICEEDYNEMSKNQKNSYFIGLMERISVEIQPLIRRKKGKSALSYHEAKIEVLKHYDLCDSVKNRILGESNFAR